MFSGIVTLLSDFGEADAFVAMLKGVLLGAAPRARLVDITHALVPGDVFESGFMLRRVYFYYPAGTIHLLGADASLGAAPALLAQAGEHWLLGADSGGLALVLEREAAAGHPVRVWRLPPAPASTFLARDSLAPAAAALLGGCAPDALGEPVAAWRRIELPRPRVTGQSATGEVLRCDRFGNALTNLTPAQLPLFQPAPTAGLRWRGRLGAHPLAGWWTPATPAGLRVFWGAEGWLEIAAAAVAPPRSTPVELTWAPEGTAAGIEPSS